MDRRPIVGTRHIRQRKSPPKPWRGAHVIGIASRSHSHGMPKRYISQAERARRHRPAYREARSLFHTSRDSADFELRIEPIKISRPIRRVAAGSVALRPFLTLR